jgi:hypothetical protein
VAPRLESAGVDRRWGIACRCLEVLMNPWGLETISSDGGKRAEQNPYDRLTLNLCPPYGFSASSPTVAVMQTPIEVMVGR